MGFDHVDRQFRPKEPIKLECIECGGTKDVETHGAELIALCPRCWENVCYFLATGGFKLNRSDTFG